MQERADKTAKARMHQFKSSGLQKLVIIALFCGEAAAQGKLRALDHSATEA